MSCLCIGGVCIPYSALIPCLLIALQWIASQFAKVGLLPDFIAKRLGMHNNNNKKTAEIDSCESKGCCAANKKSNKNNNRSDSVITAATSTNVSDEDDVGDVDVTVEHVESLDRWKEIFTNCKNQSTLFVKFTADWCAPCKAIQPAYVSAASKYCTKNNTTTFITLDIDGEDCDVLSSKLKVAMMPTFICFRGGEEIGRMSGGNSGDKLMDWVSEMCS